MLFDDVMAAWPITIQQLLLSFVVLVPGIQTRYLKILATGKIWIPFQDNQVSRPVSQKKKNFLYFPSFEKRCILLFMPQIFFLFIDLLWNTRLFVDGPNLISCTLKILH